MAITVGTLDDTGYVNSDNEHDLTVVLPANVGGLLVYVGNTVVCDAYIATFDPGGPNEVVNDTPAVINNLSDNRCMFFWFPSSALPASGTYTCRITHVNPNFPNSGMAAQVFPLDGGGAALGIRQVTSNTASSTSTITATFPAAVAAGSLVVQGLATSDDPTCTFNDLANETLDIQSATLARNSYGTAYEVDPVEDQAYSITLSTSAGRVITVAIEIEEVGGGGDTTAPTYSSNPALDSVTATSVTVVATAADETDALVNHYAVAVSNDASAPSAAQIKAGQDSTGAGAIASGSDLAVDNGVEASITLTGLTASTPYDIYWTCEDLSGNLAAPQKVDATTNAAPSLALQLDALGGDNLLVDIDTGTNQNQTNIEVVVLSGAAGSRVIVYQGTADITDGVLENIVDAAFDTVDATFEVIVIVSGTVRGVFPATVVDLNA